MFLFFKRLERTDIEVTWDMISKQDFTRNINSIFLILNNLLVQKSDLGVSIHMLPSYIKEYISD